ncbi:tRNA-splicing ligase RtcB [Desulfacinum hydrothermale DSM 13146]|uniref:tRNA-splicing ligase RtcB n=1 Tax=Desulfacinum hydrothermale DSM 13146 TaxID=1121390 RepID=A0A1W1X9N5_9BACT|nr:RtcB family protein [Desulfacinum hydrothermale]SMC20378.1 tRNA-splicing ligase RtcB [Desulfacinum hydrothermale DSM 13146]
MAAKKGWNVERLDPWRWKIPRQGNMKTDGLVYATERMMASIREEQALEQVSNVACLPGIVGSSMAMPDIHWGYGFPIGGVAAFSVEEGVVSPGGVGYDINCGVRLMTTQLTLDEVGGERIKDLVCALFRNIPSGVGSSRKDMKLKDAELDRVLLQGAAWAVSKGFGDPSDLEKIEEGGSIPWADPSKVSPRARERGRSQLGTLGSGNHFVEVGVVEEVLDPQVARVFGLHLGQITVFVHTGSRGLGHQVCDDYIRLLLKSASKYGISLPDKQLCCAPVESREGRDYLGAMGAAANFAFANRQMITHWVRETFEQFFGASADRLGLRLLYDVCHNMAKIEEHHVEGRLRKLCVHRKGATRAFAAGHPQVPATYRAVGQPVLIPGDMGRYSYVLVGTDRAMAETFGSTCHGAGRVLSRHQAIKSSKGRSIAQEMEQRGVFVMAAGKATLREEMPEAYKDVSDVVAVVHGAGISRPVARLRPLGVMKG